jgi:hypothetical protein
VLTSGQVVSGEVIQQTDSGVLIKLDYGTFTYPTSMIKNVQRGAPASSPTAASEQRIPDWGRVVSSLASKPWAHELKQVPATVVSVGVLKNVPYVSFRCASGGYELNIYGDPDQPAGIEIGVLNYQLKNDFAKSNCLSFIADVLPQEDDKTIVRNLKQAKDMATRSGFTFETTLPTEADAYNGWWISVYSEKALDDARASQNELRQITEPLPAPKPVIASVPIPHVPAIASPSSATTWSAPEYSAARRRYTSSSSAGSSGDSVYVRGYHRKDGSYVSGHYRSNRR